MMKQKNTYVITRREGQIWSFLFDAGGKAVMIRCDSVCAQPQAGDLFSARVQKIVPSLKAAFIDFEPGGRGYLPLESCRKPVMIHKGGSPSLQEGDELVVQLKKISPGQKLPSFTAELSFAGKYAVLQEADLPPGVSHQLAGESREKWRQIAASLSNEEYSVLIRTNAESAGEEEVRREVAKLSEKLSAICRKALHVQCPGLLSGREKRWLGRLLELNLEETGRIRIEDRELYQEAERFLSDTQPRLLDTLAFYEDPMLPMDRLYSLDRHMSEALDKKVWLKSGAFLVIEQTEALVSIDVNTGKAAGHGNSRDREKQFLDTNMEAAGEIARQLRLRNLSGIILIDFINMKKEDSRQILLSAFRQILREDTVRCSCIEYTGLGLVEMTRMRTEKSLAESLHSA